MLLTIDIGNSNITLGIFEDKKLIKTFRLVSDKNMNSNEYKKILCSMFESYKINKCIIASVVDELNHVLKTAVDNCFNINSILLNNELSLGLKIKLKNPNEAGADRIANACAGNALYKKPLIIVDSGTATTFDIIDKNGDFIGGIIMPGINLQLKALNSFTSKLPKIEAEKSKNAIGNNTIDAILSGVIRGSACTIEGLITQCEKELGCNAQIIATGGFSSLISEYMNRKFDDINPNLTLEGLRILYELNKNKL